MEANNKINNDILIRLAKESDIPYIDKQLYQVHKVHSDARPDLFKQGVKKYNDDLCVDENMRGYHIGTRLYEYVVGYAKNNEFYNLTLNVWADNKKAVGFYEKIGLKIQKIGMEKILN